jgi:hypothetical protein
VWGGGGQKSAIKVSRIFQMAPYWYLDSWIRNPWMNFWLKFKYNFQGKVQIEFTDKMITVVQCKENRFAGNQRNFDKEKNFKNMTSLKNGKYFFYSLDSNKTFLRQS